MDGKNETWVVETISGILKLRILNKPLWKEVSEEENKEYLSNLREKTINVINNL